MSTFSKKTTADWQKLAAKDLGEGKSPDELTWQTPEGIAVKPLYTADDLEKLEADHDKNGDHRNQNSDSDGGGGADIRCAFFGFRQEFIQYGVNNFHDAAQQPRYRRREAFN